MPPPPCGRVRPDGSSARARLLRVLAVGGGLWTLAMSALVATQGWQETLTQMGWFFAKAALVTFGGAYAVLPYVNRAPSPRITG